MTTVDNRIVHMTFDNKEFERNIAQSMASMEKMKQSLNFSGAQNSFNEINRASNSFHLGGMASAIEDIAGKFTALGATAFSVISNITNRVVNAGINMAKSFAIGPITDGFHEMETNMNSIQTILANTDSKGSTLEDVNAALDQLNTYSDQTIYNFSQMARNIGTFTAAGVDLDTSVGAIKGIANLAAISGSNAEQASSAMYQLSQALASGSVKLMDWNSIVNAGMGGEVFQKALFETGKSLGTIADTPMDQTFDDWKKAGNSFRGSLEDGWLTAEVLTNTLQGFTGDLDAAQLVALGYTEEQAKEMMRLGALGKSAATEVKTLTQLLGTVKESVGSGWSKSFQIIFGDFNEAKELFTGINTAIGAFVAKQSDARNALLQGWKDLGGRTLLIESLKNAFKGLATIIKPIKEAFRDIFPPLTAKLLFDLTKRFSEFTDRIAISGLTALRLKVIFKGIFSIVQIVIEIVKQAASTFKELYDNLMPSNASGGILNFFEDIAVKVIALKKILVDEGGIAKFFDGLIAFFKDPIPVIKGFIEDVKNLFHEVIDILFFGGFSGVGPWEEDSPYVNALFNFREKIMGFIDSLKGAFDQIKNILLFGDFIGSSKGPFEEDSPIIDAAFKFRDKFAGVIDFIRETVDKVKGLFDGLDFDFEFPQGIKDFFNSFGSFDDNLSNNTTNSTDFAGGMDRITTALGYLWDAFKKVLDILSEVGDVVGWVWDQFKSFTGFIGDAFSAIFDFAKNIGPNLQKAFMSDEFDRFLDFLNTVALLMGGAGIGKIAKDGLSVDVTGGSLTNLSQLFKDLSSTLPGVKKNIEGLTGVFSAMQTEIKANALMKIAIAIGILTASMVVLSFIDPEALAKSLAALSVGFGQLVGAMALMTKVTGSGPQGAASLTALATGMILLSTAVLILSAAVVVLAQLSWEELGRGMAAVTSILLVMIGTAKLMEGSTASLIAAGVGMVGIGIALNLIAASMLIFSSMSWEEMGKGFAGVVGSLIAITIAMKKMPKTMPATAAGLVLVGVALNLIAASMLIFATMSMQEMGKGMLAIGAALLIIAFAMKKMPLTMVASAAALVLVGVALNLLALALKQMGSMNMKEIGKSLLVLTASLLVISAAMDTMMFAQPGAVALGIVAVSLLLLSKVLKEFGGMKLKDLAKGLLAIVAVIAVLALSALAAQPAIGALLALGIALGLLGAAFALFGIGAALLAEAFQIIAAAGTAGIDVLLYAIDSLLQRLPEMATQFAESLILFAQMILDASPALIEGIGKVLGALLDQVILLVPKIVQLGIDLVKGLLEGIRSTSPDIVKTGLQILLDFLHGLEDNITEITRTVATIIVKFVEELAKHAEEIVTAGYGLLASIVEGIANGQQLILDAGVSIITKFLEGLVGAIGQIGEAVGKVIDALIEEFFKLQSDIIDAGTDALVGFLKGLAKNVWEIAHNVGLMVTNIMNALADEFVAAADRAAQIVIDFLNDLAEVIRKNDDKLHAAFVNLAKACVEGFVTVLLGPDIVKMAKDAAVNLMKSAFNAARDAILPGSPSRLWAQLGVLAATGFAKGLDDDESSETSAKEFAKRTTYALQKTMSEIPNAIADIPEFTPTITPVLDLTNVKTTAGQLNGMLNDNTLAAQVSLDQARVISTNTNGINEDTTSDTKDTGPKEVKFEQNIYSPTQLNTAAIYRQSRNQIELAKKELAIP